MKNFIILCFLLSASLVHAGFELDKLVGNWKGYCIPAVVNGQQGFTLITLTFKKPNIIEINSRNSSDSDVDCVGTIGGGQSRGVLTIKAEKSNLISIPEGTYEFLVQLSIRTVPEKGQIWLSNSGNTLRISGNFENESLGLIELRKQ